MNISGGVTWLGVEQAGGRWWNVYSDGTRLPLIQGGAPDDGEDDGEGGEGDGGEGESGAGGGTGDGGAGGGQGDDDDDQDGYRPPSREEWEATQSKLKRANKEAARRRKWLESAGIDPRTGQALPGDDHDEDDDQDENRDTGRKKKGNDGDDRGARDRDDRPDDDRAAAKAQRNMERAVARTEMKFKFPLARTAAKAALADAGFVGKDHYRVMKLIDLDEVDLDDDGEVIGIEDQIDAIKTEFPEWFRRRRNGAGPAEGGKSTRDVGGGDKKREKDTKPKTWKEKLAERMETG